MSLVFVPSGSKPTSETPTAQQNAPMEWTTKHDIKLCLDVLLTKPFQAKKKTTQRAQLWQTVADNLKMLDWPKFKVTITKRSVQDRTTLLCEKYKKRMPEKKKALGISPDMTELDKLVEEIIEKEEVFEEQRKDEGDTKKKIEEDRQKAIDMRQKAMEKLSETKKGRLMMQVMMVIPQGLVKKARKHEKQVLRQLSS